MINMAILCISISHKTAPVAVRQKFAFRKEDGSLFAKSMIAAKEAEEMVIVSTCNRTELYFVGQHVSGVRKAWTLWKQCSSDEAAVCMRIYREEKAIAHIFQVTAGFDSLILGEDEILGQVKESYENALEQKTSGFVLNTLFREAITCAKRIKTDTDISKLSVSIGTLVAHEVFRRQHTESGEKKAVNVFIIGLTGTIGTIIRKNLYGQPGVRILGTKRAHTAMPPKVREQVTVVDYQKRYAYMDEADVIISATKSPHYTITAKAFQSHIQTQKPRLLIDLAVPRDIQEELAGEPNIELKNIDAFETVREQNNQLKLRELERAECIQKQWIDDTKKELLFHDLRKDIPAIAEVFQNNTFERILYRLRDQADANEFAVIAKSLQKLL